MAHILFGFAFDLRSRPVKHAPDKFILKWLLAALLLIEGIKFIIFVIRH
jgi:hypothetical protein